ncbi:hypothetical protein D7X25_21340 [bacterium 1XD42-8]|nr:hypothetical protein D7X25_21340 [bacterium 1XD42-8]
MFVLLNAEQQKDLTRYILGREKDQRLKNKSSPHGLLSEHFFTSEIKKEIKSKEPPELAFAGTGDS